MTKYQIIENAELPQKQYYPSRTSEFPFADMAVNDAFDVDWESEGKRARSAAYAYARRNDWDFATCRISKKTMRIKRIS